VGLVASIGADHVLDYTREDFAEGEQTYDLILDIAGNAPLARLRLALAADGTLVIAGGESAGRWLGGVDRQLRALALVAVRRAAADDVRMQGALRGLERLARRASTAHPAARLGSNRAAALRCRP
jgi:NADPH:quinone reductase-like Zn-dependent oxidoreductase